MYSVVDVVGLRADLGGLVDGKMLGGLVSRLFGDKLLLLDKEFLVIGLQLLKIRNNVILEGPTLKRPNVAAEWDCLQPWRTRRCRRSGSEP